MPRCRLLLREPSIAACLLAGVVLAGCETPREPLVIEPPPEMIEAPPAEPPLPPVAEPPPRETIAGLPPDRLPVPRAKPPLPAGLPRGLAPLAPLLPKDIIGLDQARTISQIGPPHEIAEEPPATVWRYAADDCRLTIHFFPNVQSRDFRALSVELVAGDQTPEGRRKCFDRLRRGAGS